MQKIDQMGMRVPGPWKDELYSNELTKLDCKEQLKRRTSGLDDYQMQSAKILIYQKDGKPININFGSYFDKSIKKNYQMLQKAKIPARPVMERPQTSNLTCSAGKNIKSRLDDLSRRTH